MESCEAEIVEKKSRFIAVAHHVDNEEEAMRLVEQERKKHRDARHVCYAYFIDGGKSVRASDDGEPSGTAGVPILDLIKKRGLTDVLVTVTRYFGGILLGAPGLVRAYSASAKAALDTAKLGIYSVSCAMHCSCEYKDYDKLCYLLDVSGAYSIKTDFAEHVDVFFSCDIAFSEEIAKKINDTFGGKVKVENNGEFTELRSL